MKKILLLLLLAGLFAPLALFANSDSSVHTDIISRSLNFVVFFIIMWYLLASKLRAFFAGRKEGIQAQLDKVQDLLKASEDKTLAAKQKLEDAKILSIKIIEGASSDVKLIEEKVETNTKEEINILNKHQEQRMQSQSKKSKHEALGEVLDELFDDKNISLTQDELAQIIIKKVA